MTRASVLLLALACSSSPATTTPQRAAAPSPAPLDAAPPPPADASPPDAGPPTIAAECSASEIDLEDLFAHKLCTVERTKAEIPAGLAISIDPPLLQVRRGKPATGAVVIANPTGAPVDLSLSYACGLEEQVSTMIFDIAGNRRVDLAPATCGGGRGCGGVIVHIRLPPGGRARYPFEASTRLEEADERCSPFRGKQSVPPGRYQLRVHALFLPDVVTGEIVIQK
jgi:hypothetical protein